MQASRLGDSRDGPQKVGLAKPEGLGKEVRVKTDQGAWCYCEGRPSGPGEPVGGQGRTVGKGTGQERGLRQP